MFRVLAEDSRIWHHWDGNGCRPNPCRQGNSLNTVLVEVFGVWVTYTCLQRLHWAWTWPKGAMEDFASWKRMHRILYVLFWIQWGDKCKPVFYYCVAAVFFTTAYRGTSDRDRKPWFVCSCNLYAKPFSVILSEKWLKTSAPPAQPGTHFSASVPHNVMRQGSQVLLASLRPLVLVPNFRCASNTPSLWFFSWLCPFPPASHHRPAGGLGAAVVDGPVQSQSMPCSILYLCIFYIYIYLYLLYIYVYYFSSMRLTAASPQGCWTKAWSHSYVREPSRYASGRFWQELEKDNEPAHLL